MNKFFLLLILFFTLTTKFTHAGEILEFDYPTFMGFSPSLWSIVGPVEETMTESNIKMIGQKLGCENGTSVLASFRKVNYGKTTLKVKYDFCPAVNSQFQIESFKVEIRKVKNFRRIYMVKDLTTNIRSKFIFINEYLVECSSEEY